MGKEAQEKIAKVSDAEALEVIAKYLYLMGTKGAIAWELRGEIDKEYWRKIAWNFMIDILEKELGYRKLPKDKPPDDDIVDDGFGTSCSAYCPECGEKSMFVCRPGDIRCSNCEGK